MKRMILGALLLLSITVTSCTNYSSGTRTGTVSKFSRKGLLCKTYEGELIMGGVHQTDNGSAANIFEFSLDEAHHRGEDIEALANSISNALDKGYRVTLHYNQEQFTNFGCRRGDSNYFIDKVDFAK